MLIGVPEVISPELLDVLMRMGHGDEIVLSDANFPAYSLAASLVNKTVVPISGSGIIGLLSAVLQLFPLDKSDEHPILYMCDPSELGHHQLHIDMLETLQESGYARDLALNLPRFEFYKRAGNAFAIVRTSETARFGNIILKKGVIRNMPKEVRVS